MNVRILVIIMVAVYLLIELLEMLTYLTEEKRKSISRASDRKVNTASKQQPSSTGANPDPPAGSDEKFSAATQTKLKQLQGEVAIENAIRNDDVAAFNLLVGPATPSYSVRKHGDLVFQFVNQERDWTEATDTMFVRLLEDPKLSPRINGDSNTWSPLKMALHLEGKTKAIEHLIAHPFIHPYVTTHGLSCGAIKRAKKSAPSVTFVIDAALLEGKERKKCFMDLFSGIGHETMSKRMDIKEYRKAFGGAKGGPIALTGESAESESYQQVKEERAAVAESENNKAAEAATGAAAGGKDAATNAAAGATSADAQEFPDDSLVMNPAGFTSPLQALYVYCFGATAKTAGSSTSPMSKIAIWGMLTFLVSGVLSGTIITLTVLSVPRDGGDQAPAAPPAAPAAAPPAAVDAPVAGQ